MRDLKNQFFFVFKWYFYHVTAGKSLLYPPKRLSSPFFTVIWRLCPSELGKKFFSDLRCNKALLFPYYSLSKLFSLLFLNIFQEKNEKILSFPTLAYTNASLVPKEREKPFFLIYPTVAWYESVLPRGKHKLMLWRFSWVVPSQSTDLSRGQ